MSRTNAGLSSTPNPASHTGRREPGRPSSQDWEGNLKANKVKTLAYVIQAVAQHSQGSEDGPGPSVNMSVTLPLWYQFSCAATTVRNTG